MPRLAVKTLRGTQLLEKEPNGGWAWVVTLAAFTVNGIAWGIPKTLGVFFIDIKDEFAVSNTAVSWLLTVVLSALTFAGLLAKFLMKWFDARQLIMGGGLLSGIGLVVGSISTHVAVLVIALVFAGSGLGFASITSLSQISLYFSSWRPLANGIVLSGSPIISAVYPYLMQRLLEEYGWRGAFLISGAIALNISALGSLIRPVSAVCADKESPLLNHFETMQNEDERVAEEVSMADVSEEHKKCRVAGAADTTKIKTQESLLGFFRRYSLAFGFLFVNFIFGLAVFTPLVFIVPYADQLRLTIHESTLLLSFISFGDFVGRLGTGLALSKIDTLRKNLLFIITAFIFLHATSQMVPTFFARFSSLMVYANVYGTIFGAITTFSVTAIGQNLNAKTIETGIAAFFASGGLAVLAGGPIAGAVVDSFGSFQAAFCYTMVIGLCASSACFLFSCLVRSHGMMILKV